MKIRPQTKPAVRSWPFPDPYEEKRRNRSVSREAKRCRLVPHSHKTNRILYTVTPKPKEMIQLDPNHPDYKPLPQFIVRFYYHLKRVEQTNLDFPEEERETWYAPSIWVDMFDTFEDAKRLISSSLSELGIKGKYHPQILDKIVKCRNGIASRSIGAYGGGGGICIPIVVKMLRLKVVWRCKGVECCSADSGLREAKELTISELLNKEFPNCHLNLIIIIVNYNQVEYYHEDRYDYYFCNGDIDDLYTDADDERMSD